MGVASWSVHWRNGSPTMMIARAALAHVKAVLSDPSGCREVRRRATETAMEFTWDRVAASLGEFLN